MILMCFPFLIILQFASPQVARVANCKIIKNRKYIKTTNFASYKKMKTIKNSKTKNISSVIFVFLMLFVMGYSRRVMLVAVVVGAVSVEGAARYNTIMIII